MDRHALGVALVGVAILMLVWSFRLVRRSRPDGTHTSAVIIATIASVVATLGAAILHGLIG